MARTRRGHMNAAALCGGETNLQVLAQGLALFGGALAEELGDAAPRGLGSVWSQPLAGAFDAGVFDAGGLSIVRSEVLQARRIRSIGSDDDGVLQSPAFVQGLSDSQHARDWLANDYIDASDIPRTLGSNQIQGEGGLSDVAIADDELPLASPNGNRSIDDLDS